MEDANEKIDSWKEECNNYRPHSSLEGMTPNEVVQMYQKEPEISTLALSEVGTLPVAVSISLFYKNPKVTQIFPCFTRVYNT